MTSQRIILSISSLKAPSTDHGKRRRCLLGCQRGGGAACHNQIDIQADQLGDQIRKPSGVSIDGSIIENEIAPLDISKLLQSAAKGGEIDGIELRRNRFDHANAERLAALRPR